jgi:hypothetical protein
MGTMALALSIKQLVYDVDHSHPYSAEVKNERNYTSAPLYAFMVWTETTLPSPSSRGEFSFCGRGREGRVLTKWLNAAICMESLRIVNVR